MANSEDVIVPADLEDDVAGSASALRVSPWCAPWLWSAVKVVLLVLLWHTFSTALSLYNKVLIGAKHRRLPAPLLMTTVHFFVQGAIASLLLPLVTAISWRDYFVRVVPTAVATSLDITLSSFSLALVTRTFYSMWWGRRSLSCWASSSSCWPHSWRVSDGCCCKCSSRGTHL
ncbi:unnamed protein product, partial [Closterium sp. NIES-65]